MSIELTISIIGILYLLIGILFAAIIDGANESGFFVWAVILWPVIICAFLTAIVITIPFKIGLWIRDKLNLNRYF